MATIDVLSGVTPYKSEYVALPKFDRHLDIYGAALNKIDEAHHKALQQKSAIRAAITSTGLNQKEDAWTEEYVNKIMKEIDDAAEYGNYSTALSKATELAGTALSDPSLTSRIRYNKEYETEVANVRGMQGLSQEAKDWWIETNPYDFKENKDSTGNVIGGNEFKPQAPVKSINWADEAKLAFSLVTPYKNARSTSNTNQNVYQTDLENPNLVNTHIETDSSGRQIVKVSKDAILRNLKTRLNDEDFRRQVEQAWEVERYSYTKLEKEKTRLTALLNTLDYNSSEYNKINEELTELEEKITFREKFNYRNGSPISSLEDYYIRNIENNVYVDNLHYEWITTDSTNSNRITTPKNLSNASRDNQNSSNVNTGQVAELGASGEYGANSEESVGRINASQNNAKKRFSK